MPWTLARRTPRVALAVVTALLATAIVADALISDAIADPPPGYYDSAAGLTGEALRLELHEIIDDHHRFPYTSTATDTWDIVAAASEDPGNADNVLTIYRNHSVDKDDHSQGTGWNREHSWPNSYGFSQDGSCNYPYTDCHQLFPSDWDYNSSRGNNPYDFCPGGCSSLPVDGYPTLFNYRTGDGPTGTWECWDLRRGDVARAILYMDVRYEGGTHGTTGCAEPDLRATDIRGLIVANASQNFSPAYMGVLTTLIEWHLSDPPDDFDRQRNDVVASFQGNRNPFVDHPEWVCEIWNCDGDSEAPLAPTGLAAATDTCGLALDWDDNLEPDLAGYHVYRAAAPGGPYTRITAILVQASDFVDATAPLGATSWYYVTAVDLVSNESDPSTTSSATRGPDPCAPVGTPWINEIHYDNTSTDANEGIEIAGPAGTDLSGWSLVGYNGATGTAYATVLLSGVLDDQQNGFGTKWFAFVGLQNGSPDAVAFVDDEGTVVQFLSYEGSFTAQGGPASGMTSDDILVSETSSTPLGHSLQLTGHGSSYEDFTWQPPAAHSRDLPNPGQTFEAPAISECQGIDSVHVVHVLADGIDVESGFRAIVDAAGSIELRIDLPSAGGNGKFVVHLDAGEPTSATVTTLPGQLGPVCFPFLIAPFGTASPLAVWNRIGKQDKVGASEFFGDPIPDPARAPTTFYQAATVDGSAMPPGSVFTLQGVIVNPAASSPKGASVTNAVMIEIQ